MKGYSDKRGKAWRLDYDPQSGAFIEVPIAFDIPKPAKRPSAEVVALRARRKPAPGVKAGSRPALQGQQTRG